MTRCFVTFATLLALSAPGLAQVENSPSSNISPDEPAAAVKIVHGPLVELITDSTAQIAWSTNVNAGTVLHYGNDPKKLDHSASMPWGGLTHRVVLKNLQPSTTYYFVAESAQGQDTGTRAEAPQSSFRTVGPGEPPVRNRER